MITNIISHEASVFLSRRGFTDVLILQVTRRVVPQLAFSYLGGVKLPAVLSVHPVVPVVRLTVIPETERKRTNNISQRFFVIS